MEHGSGDAHEVRFSFGQRRQRPSRRRCRQRFAPEPTEQSPRLRLLRTTIIIIIIMAVLARILPPAPAEAREGRAPITAILATAVVGELHVGSVPPGVASSSTAATAAIREAELRGAGRVPEGLQQSEAPVGSAACGSDGTARETPLRALKAAPGRGVLHDARLGTTGAPLPQGGVVHSTSAASTSTSLEEEEEEEVRCDGDCSRRNRRRAERRGEDADESDEKERGDKAALDLLLLLLLLLSQLPSLMRCT